MSALYDVAIIGGGVVGSAAARELSRYNLRICVLEREQDVVNGVSGRNTGLLHSGVLYQKDTLRLECCLEGNAEFELVAEQLDVPFKRCGKLIVGSTNQELQQLDRLMQRGMDNGIKGLRMLDRQQLKELEPDVEGERALLAETAGILDPFSYTIALAENAAMNGVSYLFGHEVREVNRESDGTFSVLTSSGTVKSRWVINCAGISSFRLSAMLGYYPYKPDRVKGEYIILDKRVSSMVSHPVYPAPDENFVFDIHVTPTIDGNVLVGPSIEHIGDGDDYEATGPMLQMLEKVGSSMFSCVRREFFIRNYVGVFPSLKNPEGTEELDYQIQTSRDNPNTVNVVGINSPGVTSALPLGRRIASIVAAEEGLSPRADFMPERKGIVRFAQCSDEQQAALIRENPEYGEIFCRCECVTKAEVKQAIHNILGVSTISGIKYRTRATMGRCQGGYCETRITDLLMKEKNLDRQEIMLNRPGAYLFTGSVRG